MAVTVYGAAYARGKDKGHVDRTAELKKPKFTVYEKSYKLN